MGDACKQTGSDSAPCTASDLLPNSDFSEAKTGSRSLATSTILCLCPFCDGGRTRARTLDPLIKSQLLYQLSYAPITVISGAVQR